MTAKVTEETTYHAYCWDCDWFGEGWENEDEAEMEAADHDQECHA